MRTNVSIIVNSEGGLMSDVAERFNEIGFKPSLGMHDFQYDWEVSELRRYKFGDNF